MRWVRRTIIWKAFGDLKRVGNQGLLLCTVGGGNDGHMDAVRVNDTREED